ncbi:MAG: hypothetical protein V4635_17175 [Bacteroidota bacterium]
MKKLIYSISLVTLISIAGKAQTDKPAGKQEATKKEAAASHEVATPQNVVKEEKAPAAEPKNGGTRMAINEKGVPATKAAKAPAAAKEEKAVSPGQPAATEKK